MGKKNNKRKKEEIAEEWCFVCKDGGELRVCDFRDCLKTYHAKCLGHDASFMENDNNWCCGSHYCYLCGRASKFMCLCCPIAVCGRCFYDAEFATVKRNKGFCRHCSKLAFLIETNADVDSDGEKIDMRDPDTVESYFLEYYQVIKEREGLNSQDIYIARDIVKNGKNKRDLDPYEIGEGEDDTGDSDVSNFIGSDCDDFDETSRVKSVKRKKCTKKLKSIKGKVAKDKKKDFVGWGSRSLIDFLKNIGRDTTKAFSEIEVASIVNDYCHKHQLFDPKKKKIICDANLKTLLRRRKTVKKNNIQKLLASHFVDNFEETDSSSEERDDNEAFKFRKHRNLNSTIKSCQNVRSKELPSGFAAIVSSNIKLVYLKRSLIEELLKQPETDGKVLGSYVRIKSDPNDYLQKNSHLLVQVKGINRSSKQDDISQEILLRLSNVPKDVPISQISDVDFSEEECQDLYQRMTNGLPQKPTILELEKKARTLHEDITKHWISREIELLRNRIDRANEKGWRREYPFMIYLYMDQKQKLESAAEQSRLLSEIPKVIPELVGTNLSPEDSSRKDMLEKKDLPELDIGETCDAFGQYSSEETCDSTHDGFTQCPDKRADVVGPKSPVKNNQDDPAFPAPVEQLSALLKESNSNCQTLNPEKCGLPQSSNTISASDDVNCRNLSTDMDANHAVKERRSASVADPVKVIVNDATVLSDSDEEDVSIEVTSSGRKGVESIDIPIWYCSGVRGCGTRGPFPMTVLKHWSELDSTYAPLDFKVWKTGESEREAMLLRDALKLFFP
ncbi:zinc finger CCCH domain protein [Medicago truncatula]|uniref:Zinc finger CCCH domain protein n=1 Tax=Medicago truncatula TaxID=3880 RepID=G7J7X2_MEDTR|nr:zinc finger CCCH domain protein [Medicago truncatula]